MTHYHSQRAQVSFLTCPRHQGAMCSKNKNAVYTSLNGATRTQRLWPSGFVWDRRIIFEGSAAAATANPSRESDAQSQQIRCTVLQNTPPPPTTPRPWTSFHLDQIYEERSVPGVGQRPPRVAEATPPQKALARSKINYLLDQPLHIGR